MSSGVDLTVLVPRGLPEAFSRALGHGRTLGRVLLGSTVFSWLSWLGFFVFYWEKTVFGWFG